MDFGKQAGIQSDEGTQDYEAIQGDEEIQVDEGVQREADAAVESIEPGSLNDTIPAKSTCNVSKKTGIKKKQNKKPKHSAGQQIRSKGASSFNLGEDDAANQTDYNDSPEVVELGSASAKELQSQRREKEQTSQVMKEKEQVMKEKEKVTMTLSVDVPILIEISEDDNEEDEAFERHWSSKICNECGSSVRHQTFTFSNFQLFSSVAGCYSTTHSLRGIQVCLQNALIE